MNVDGQPPLPRPIPLYQVWLKSFRTLRKSPKTLIFMILLGTSAPFGALVVSKWPWSEALVSRLKADLPTSPGVNGQPPDIVAIFNYLGSALAEGVIAYVIFLMVQLYLISVVLRMFTAELHGMRPAGLRSNLVAALRRFPLTLAQTCIASLMIIFGYAIAPLLAVISTAGLLWPILYSSSDGHRHRFLRQIITLSYAAHLRGGRLLSLAQITLTTFVCVSLSTMWYLLIKTIYSTLAANISAPLGSLPQPYVLLDVLAVTGFMFIAILFACILRTQYHCVTMIPRFKTFA